MIRKNLVTTGIIRRLKDHPWRLLAVVRRQFPSPIAINSIVVKISCNKSINSRDVQSCPCKLEAPLVTVEARGHGIIVPHTVVTVVHFKPEMLYVGADYNCLSHSLSIIFRLG